MNPRLLATAAGASALVLTAAAHAGAEQGGRHVADLRDATARYSSLEVAVAEGFGVVQDLSGATCIEDAHAGGMGTHYALGSRIGDGDIDLLEPEILLYDMTGDTPRFLGVEYVVIAADWHAEHGTQPPKQLGKKFTFVPAGNRYGLPAFYEQHVWIGASNVAGLLQDYNPDVDC